MTPEEWATVRHFKPSEFVAPDLMDAEFVRFLDRVRERAGVPIRVVSTVRTVAHNAEVGGAPRSAHLDVPCKAGDIAPLAGLSQAEIDAWRSVVLDALRAEGCTRVGIYPDHLHADMTGQDVGGSRPSGVVWLGHC